MDGLNKNKKGYLHPMTQMINEINSIFFDMGFEIADGPEMESEHYNFDALNMPENHPARGMQDTFWIKNKENSVMRTHTSNAQVRYMENNKPPIRIIVPGKVFRNEATDATHEAQFYQVEGLMVDKDINVAHLKSMLNEFLSRLFGEDVKIRLRPSFFPFVEPGAEVDIGYYKHGEGIKLGKAKDPANQKWMEILGAGMVDPEVFRMVGYDPEITGFAFGLGVERIAMLRYGIDDIRHFYANDLRFLEQF